MKWNFPISRLLSKILLWFVFVALVIWGAGVSFYSSGFGLWGLLLYLFVVGAGVHFRASLYSRYGVLLVVFSLLLFYWAMPPSNNRDWQASWSQMPECVIDGHTLTIHNVRDFHYRTEDDYDVRYVTKTYNLNLLSSLDFAVSHWDGIENVSHTLLTFGFSDGQYLALSAETRLDKQDKQGAVAGLFNCFELLFIFATEEDIFALRTNYRHEDLYLYRTTITDNRILRSILLDFAGRANELRYKPQFYNTVTNNCTTALRNSLERYIDLPASRYNIGSILNGYVDQKAFNQNLLQQRKNETFDELRRRALIPHDISEDNPEYFSGTIRAVAGITGD